MHHHMTETIRATQERLPDPPQVAWRLIAKRPPRPDAGVHAQIISEHHIVVKRSEEAEIFRRNVFLQYPKYLGIRLSSNILWADTITGSTLFAAVQQPGPELGHVFLHPPKKALFMISHQEVGPGKRGESMPEKINNTAGIRAAINDVPQKDENHFLCGLRLVMR
jgi:hypothetical protein